jgi:hypothetical protein
MKLSRRRVLHLAAGAAALPGISRIASAQAYPARPVTIVVPFAAGGSSDVSARIVGEYMARTLGQQFIIENVPGAGGTTGSTRASAIRGSLADSSAIFRRGPDQGIGCGAPLRESEDPTKSKKRPPTQAAFEYFRVNHSSSFTWLRIFVVRCGLPCDPPLGGHSCNGGMIPRFHRGVCD